MSSPPYRIALIASFVVALAAVAVLDRSRAEHGRQLRTRLLLGLPWGSIVTATVVLFAYLFVQGGWNHWYAPVTIPFRAWSYFYPLGMITAGFTHVGPGHLIGNLIGTLTLGAIAEYAWGHFPRSRGSTSFGSWRTNPYVRGFLVVPVVMLGAAFATALFGLGPIIGFSGAVFAIAGFALVTRPFSSVLALTAGNVVRLVYGALREPTLVVEARPIYSTPWWSRIAIQGHALGIVIGIVLGAWLLRRRDAENRPSTLRLMTGVVLFTAAQSLWAVYWYRGSETYVLYRAAGLSFVLLFATLVVVAVRASDRPLLDVRGYDVGETIRTAPRWQFGMAAILLLAAVLSGVAVPVNLSTVGTADMPGEELEIRDYEVTYAEDVSNGMVSVVEVDAFGETTSVNTSGVIVRSSERGIWLTAATAGRLAFAGKLTVRLGGVGWREPLVVTRDGWSTVEGNTTYRVFFTHDERTYATFASDPVTADPVVNGRSVGVAARLDGFDVVVSRQSTTARAPIPAENSSVVLDGIRILREDDRLIAVSGETRVPIARAETYRGQRN